MTQILLGLNNEECVAEMPDKTNDAMRCDVTDAAAEKMEQVWGKRR